MAHTAMEYTSVVCGGLYLTYIQFEIISIENGIYQDLLIYNL